MTAKPEGPAPEPDIFTFDPHRKILGSARIRVPATAAPSQRAAREHTWTLHVSRTMAHVHINGNYCGISLPRKSADDQKRAKLIVDAVNSYAFAAQQSAAKDAEIARLREALNLIATAKDKDRVELHRWLRQSAFGNQAPVVSLTDKPLDYVLIAIAEATLKAARLEGVK